MRTMPRGPGVFTLADLDDWPESTLIELHEGCIVVNPPPTARHATVVSRATEWLIAAGFERADVLQAVGIGFATEPGDGFIPDLVLMRPGADLDVTWQPPSAIRIVVEVLSPSTSTRDLGHKRDVYLAAGLTCVMIDPVTEAFVDVAGQDAWLTDVPF